MNKKYYLLPFLAVGAGAATYFLLPQISIFAPLTNGFSSIFTWITNGFGSLNDSVQTLITGAVPTAGASLAAKALYDKLKKSRDIAVTRVQDVQGDLLQVNTLKNQALAQVKTLEAEVQGKTAAISTLEQKLVDQHQEYETKLAKAQQTITDKTNEYNLAVRTLAEQSKIKEEPTRVP